jgi:hypothetical protein
MTVGTRASLESRCAIRPARGAGVNRLLGANPAGEIGRPNARTLVLELREVAPAAVPALPLAHPEPETARRVNTHVAKTADGHPDFAAIRARLAGGHQRRRAQKRARGLVRHLLLMTRQPPDATFVFALWPSPSRRLAPPAKGQARARCRRASICACGARHAPTLGRDGRVDPTRPALGHAHVRKGAASDASAYHAWRPVTATDHREIALGTPRTRGYETPARRVVAARLQRPWPVVATFED